MALSHVALMIRVQLAALYLFVLSKLCLLDSTKRNYVDESAVLFDMAVSLSINNCSARNMETIWKPCFHHPNDDPTHSLGREFLGSTGGRAVLSRVPKLDLLRIGFDILGVDPKPYDLNKLTRYVICFK